jgi:hypothetical protein
MIPSSGMLIPIIDKQPDVKEWTEWHTNLAKLLYLVRSVVLEDQEKKRLARKSGNVQPAPIE